MATRSFLLFFSLAYSAAIALGDDSSLTQENSESTETTAVLAIEKLIVENRKLREDLESVRKTAAAVTAESEVFKRQVNELTLRMEALGASTTSPTALEQRVLQAANALRQSQINQERLSKALLRLAKVSSEFAKKPDAEARIALEAELKSADNVIAETLIGDLAKIGDAPPEPVPDLMNAKVSAVKPEIGCVVVNIGAVHGAKVGMPFQVRRGDKLIATIRMVDVRQSIAGAVIQNLLSEKDPIQLGDTIKVDAQL